MNEEEIKISQEKINLTEKISEISKQIKGLELEKISLNNRLEHLCFYDSSFILAVDRLYEKIKNE